MVYVDTESESIFGRMNSKTVSEVTQQKVDAEIRSLLDTQYTLARHLLETNRDKVEAMVVALMEWETIDADQVNDIMAGNPPRPPKVSDPVNTTGGDGSTPTPAQGSSPATV